jgi:hypothetical protein
MRKKSVVKISVSKLGKRNNTLSKSVCPVRQTEKSVVKISAQIRKTNEMNCIIIIIISTTDETLVVEMRIWCIKIGNVFALHYPYTCSDKRYLSCHIMVYVVFKETVNASPVTAPTMVVAYSNLKNVVYGGQLSVVISANNHTVSNKIFINLITSQYSFFFIKHRQVL